MANLFLKSLGPGRVFLCDIFRCCFWSPNLVCNSFAVVSAAMLSMGYGFVEYKTKKSAVNAIKKLQVFQGTLN